MKNLAGLMGKYCSTSAVATSADFAMFQVALAYMGVSPVLSTVCGRTLGAMVAFWLHRSWVFSHSKRSNGNVLRLRYVSGIMMGMGLNVAGVWALNSVLAIEAWPARITTAVAVWLFGFVFNKKLVFR